MTNEIALNAPATESTDAREKAPQEVATVHDGDAMANIADEMVPKPDTASAIRLPARVDVPMPATRLVGVEAILPRADVRAINESIVREIAESIELNGLLNPIHVRMAEHGYELIAGAHRLAAFRRLGYQRIPCFVLGKLDDLRSELAMIDENLCRAGLGPSELSYAVGRRKSIYEALHPATVHGANLEGPGVANSATPDTPARFTAATAMKMGVSERTVQLHVERGEKVAGHVLHMLAGTPADKGVVLDEIKNVEPEEQEAVAKRKIEEARKKRKAPVDAETKAHHHFEKLLSVWNVASEKARSEFLVHIKATLNV